MALPTVAKTWNISACNRISFTSLNDTMSKFLFGIASYLISKGWVVKGSCNGTTGAMDGINRWGSASNVTTRGSNTTTANSWIVLTDAFGYDICFSYVGASDDVARLSVSFAGDYVAAATPNQTPVTSNSSNEEVFLSGVSLIMSATSQDRVWSCWASSDAKSFRVSVARNGVWTGYHWGVEEYTKRTLDASVTFQSNSFAFAFITAAVSFASLNAANCTAYQLNLRGGYALTVVSSVIRACTLALTTECFGDNTVNAAPEKQQNFAPELDGGTDYTMKRVGLYSTLTGARGKIGNIIDWWIGRAGSGIVDGDTYGSLQFINMSETVWPWDGTTTVVMS
jgi:hypothetical protein